MVLLEVEFDFSLMSSFSIFIFALLGSKEFNIELSSKTSYIPHSNVYPIFDPATYLLSNIPICL